MTHSEQNYLSFENELRNDSEETALDYLAVESKLFARIQAAERFGEVSALKADVILPFDFFESVEKNLTARISNYREYEEPIDECIREQYDLSHTQWERLEHKLNEKIHDIQDLPLWETILKAPVVEPIPEGWESIEQKLFDQIATTRYQTNWEICTKSDEIVIPGEAERLDTLIQKRINNSELSSWEQVIRSEEVLPYKKWEEYEELLFERIHNISNIPKQPFWYIIEQYLTLKNVGVFAALLLVAALGVGGYLLVNQVPGELPSVVYQMQGTAALQPELSGIQNGTLNSFHGGSITFVNAHGSVSMQNDSKIELRKISRNDVYYRVHFNEGAINRERSANVAFFVKKNASRNLFKVETPDYDILVKGTYFCVEPDFSGRVSTRVLEGAVKISSSEFGDTMLYAGQSIVYDPHTDRYRIDTKGTIVAHNKIESLPDAGELQAYRAITIKTGNPISEVLIDGRSFGSAPLIIRQPVGVRRVKVRTPGFVEFDSLVQVTGAGDDIVLELQLQQIEKPIVQGKTDSVSKSLPERVVSGKSTREVIHPEIIQENPLDIESVDMEPVVQGIIDEKYYAAQKAEIAGAWKSAILLYQEVFDDQRSSKLKKEDALFSIGKLRAEHETDASEAKQVFLKYLALYPNGSFTGESWLRLAELEFATNQENSIQYYNKFFEMFPQHPRLSELQSRVGIIYLQTKRYRDAVSMFRRALSNNVTISDSDRRQIYSNLYRALEESGDTQAAEIVKKEHLVQSR